MKLVLCRAELRNQRRHELVPACRLLERRQFVIRHTADTKVHAARIVIDADCVIGSRKPYLQAIHHALHVRRMAVVFHDIVDDAVNDGLAGGDQGRRLRIGAGG